MADNELQTLIDACEKEPIHIPGGIQPFGALLSFTPGFEEICFASENISDFFTVDNIWTTSATDLFGASVCEVLQTALDSQTVATAQTEHFHLTVYVSNPYWVVELEPVAERLSTSTSALLAQAFSRFKSCHDKNSLLQALTREVRAITRFERVVLYQFDEEWQGRVMAESKGNNLGSLLGHHFPASDIPPQARAMYSRNSLRLIYSASALPVPVGSNPARHQGPPVDMSQGNLRAVSPLHMQYLKNLGVGASCSLGIFREERLWGLIACHHTTEILLGPEAREALKLLTQFAEQRLFLLEAADVQAYQRRTHELRDELIKASLNLDTPQQIIKTHGHYWLELLRACG
jgi:light-regulated signal transduction histidine kinase (bacteriophytochrome)